MTLTNQHILNHLILILFLFTYRYFEETDLSHDQTYELVELEQMHVLKPSINSNPATTSTLPILIVHPGPHKTGTSSIQASLRSKQSVLQLDNYIDTQSHFNAKDFATQLGMREGVRDKKILSEVKTFFEEAESQKENVIMSKETFNDVNPSDLQSFIGPGFHYRIVIMYRRYYEWIFSVYQQQYKKKLVQFIDIGTFLTSIPVKRPFHSGEIFDSYKKVFDDVAVLNYHNGKSIMESFFCEGVINADHICQDVKDTPEEHVNTAQLVEGRRVIFDAKENKMISSNVNVTEILDEVTNRVEEELIKENNPLTSCVEDDVMETLFQFTMYTERRLLPEWFDEERLRESFDEFCKKRSKLCYMNMDAVYQDRGWIDFLGSL